MRLQPRLPILAALALASLVACSDSSDPFKPNMPDAVPTPTSQIGGQGAAPAGAPDDTPSPTGKCPHSVHPRCE